MPFRKLAQAALHLLVSEEINKASGLCESTEGFRCMFCNRRWRWDQTDQRAVDHISTNSHSADPNQSLWGHGMPSCRESSELREQDRP